MRMKTCTKVAHNIQQIANSNVNIEKHVPPLGDHGSLRAVSVVIVHSGYGIVPHNWKKDSSMNIKTFPINQMKDSLFPSKSYH